MTKQKENKKRKFPWGIVIWFLCCIGIGIVLGTVMAESNMQFEFKEMAALVLFFLVAQYLHILLHEAGHMIAGLMTGYSFQSYRVGSLMWEKQADGKIHFSRFSLAGTGGQCLMQPPAYNDGKYPYVWYNLGGVLMNFFLSAVAGVGLIFSQNPWVNMFLWMMLICGVMFGLLNGVPLKTKQLSNDGCNIVSISKSEAAKRAFWLQMQVNHEVAMGKRLKEMPDEWFAPFPESERANVIVTSVDVFRVNREMDRQALKTAEEKMLTLVQDENVAGIYRQLMVFDLAYCEMVQGKAGEYTEKMQEQESRQFAKAMKAFPSIIRTQYAYELLVVKDTEKAEKCREAFEKIGKKYPHPCEIESERELMQLAADKAAQTEEPVA